MLHAILHCKALRAGGTLGVVCSHEYAKTSDSRLTQEMLKGSDALAFAVAAQLGLQPELRYVFKEDPKQFDPVITGRFADSLGLVICPSHPASCRGLRNHHYCCACAPGRLQPLSTLWDETLQTRTTPTASCC